VSDRAVSDQQDQEFGEWLRAQADVGLAQARAGQFREVDPHGYFKALRARIKARMRDENGATTSADSGV
jgi:hypothetical protein